MARKKTAEVEVEATVQAQSSVSANANTSWLLMPTIDENTYQKVVTGISMYNGDYAPLKPTSICDLQTLDKRYMIANGPSAGVSSFNSRSGVVTLESEDVIDALGYIPANGSISAGVSSFNNRTGSVVLASEDVVNALGFVPSNGTTVAGVTSFDGRTGNITLVSGDVVSALGFTPVQASNISKVGLTGLYSDLIGSPSPYSLPVSNATVLGGVKVGANLTIDSNGVLSALGNGSGGNGLPVVNYTIQGQNYTGFGNTSVPSGLAGSLANYDGTSLNSILYSGYTNPAGGVDLESFVEVSNDAPEVTVVARNGPVSQTLNLAIDGATLDFTSDGMSPRKWSGNSILTQDYADTRYALSNAPSVTGVTSYNGRTGNVTFQNTDINQPVSLLSYYSSNLTIGRGNDCINTDSNPNLKLTGFGVAATSNYAYAAGTSWKHNAQFGVEPQSGGALQIITTLNSRSDGYSGANGTGNLTSLYYSQLEIDSFTSVYRNHKNMYNNGTVSGYFDQAIILIEPYKGTGDGGISLQSTYYNGSALTTIALNVTATTATNTVTIQNQAALTWTDDSVLTRKYADSRYGLKVAAVTAQPPLTANVTIGNKTLVVENGLITGVLDE